MYFKNFDEIIAHVGGKAKRARLAVAAAADAHTLEAVLKAEAEGRSFDEIRAECRASWNEIFSRAQPLL